jgi:hypothetical protein
MNRKELIDKIVEVLETEGEFRFSDGSDNGDASIAIEEVDVEGLSKTIYRYGVYEYIGDGDSTILSPTTTAASVEEAVGEALDEALGMMDFDEEKNPDGFIFKKVNGLINDCTYIVDPTM